MKGGLYVSGDCLVGAWGGETAVYPHSLACGDRTVPQRSICFIRVLQWMLKGFQILERDCLVPAVVVVSQNRNRRVIQRRVRQRQLLVVPS